MFMRYTASFGSAAAVTCGLLLVMELLIASDDGPLINARPPRIVDFLRVVRTPPPAPIDSAVSRATSSYERYVA